VYRAEGDGEGVAGAQQGRPLAGPDRELPFQDVHLLRVAGVPVQRRLEARGALPSIKSYWPAVSSWLAWTVNRVPNSQKDRDIDFCLSC
jgi:hypothetical protein